MTYKVSSKTIRVNMYNPCELEESVFKLQHEIDKKYIKKFTITKNKSITIEPNNESVKKYYNDDLDDLYLLISQENLL